MRKKFFLLALAAVLLPLSASAQEYYEDRDGLSYQLFGETAELIRPLSGIPYSGDIVIPPTITTALNNTTYIVSGIRECLSGMTMTSIVLSDNITKIERRTFEGCLLSKVEIGNSVTRIEKEAFGGLKYLKDFICHSEVVPDTDPDAFSSFTYYIPSNHRNATLHVEKNSIDAYRASSPWNQFKSIVAIGAPTHILTYIVDGEVYKAEDYIEGETITALEHPSKDGYIFSGWSDIPETMPAHDVTVTGSFTPVPSAVYTITYIVDGEVYKTYDYHEGDGITPEAEPTKEGYTFSGWSWIPSKMPGENVTITGTFTVNKYTLTYMIDGVEFKSYEVEYGTTITPETVTDREGFSFSGWDNLPDTMPASDVVVTGSFSKGSYTLTYILDGVTYKTYTYGYDESITPESVPDKEGYTFTGWDDLPDTMPGHDVTVTGSYTVNKYKLIYMVDGEVYMTIEVEYGATITPEDEPTKDGYVFSGWSWIPSKMPAEDVTISGTFKQIGYNIDDNIYVVDGNEVTLAKSNVAGGDIIISPTVIINNNVYNVTTIGQYAFANNNGIKSVTIPDGVTTIGDNAFEGCSGIRKITLGKDVGFIGRRSFADIWKSGVRTRSEEASLTVEYHADKVPGAYYDSFEGTDISSAVLKVNDDLVSTFKATSPWNGFGAVIGFNEAEALGIGTVMTAEKETEIFSIDGRRLNKTVKGLNIIRTSKGVKKLYSK